MGAVTAKFRVTRLTPWGQARVVDGVIVPSPEDGEGVVTAEVELTPDYAGGKNAEWAKATPSGVMRLTITNPAALSVFKEGRSFTVTLSPEDQ